MRFGRTLIAAVCIMALVGCSGGDTKTSASGGEETIKIGASVSLTGGSALWGQSERNALEMEVQKINDAGGVLGKKLELVVYDNKADQTEAVNVAKRLVSDGVVGIIGVAQSGVAIASAGVTNPAGVILISTTGTNTKVTVPESDGKALDYVYRTCFIDPYQGEVAATFAFETLGVTKAAVLMDVGSDYSQGLSQYFKETFTSLGGTIVADEAFRSEELEYKAQLAVIKEANPEVLFIPTMQKEAGLAMKQAKELGLECYFMGGDGWASQELVELGGEATEGSFYVNIASLEDPTIKEWVEEYEAKYGTNPVMPNPVLAVDAIQYLAAAIEGAGSTDPAAVTAWMASCQGLPVLTGTLNMDAATHNPTGRTAVIETVKDGAFTFYQAVAAE